MWYLLSPLLGKCGEKSLFEKEIVVYIEVWTVKILWTIVFNQLKSNLAIFLYEADIVSTKNLRCMKECCLVLVPFARIQVSGILFIESYSSCFYSTEYLSPCSVQSMHQIPWKHSVCWGDVHRRRHE